MIERFVASAGCGPTQCWQRRQNGIVQRLRNHMRGQSSLAAHYLKRDRSRLWREKYEYRWIAVPNGSYRALLEAYAIGPPSWTWFKGSGVIGQVEFLESSTSECHEILLSQSSAIASARF
jgi:hypothetical protein